MRHNHLVAASVICNHCCMIYRALGSSGLDVSLLGYGAWALGKKGWPGVNEKAARQTLEHCYENGITFFDTAPVYGFGTSELILGQALKGVRKNIVIATKCGLRWDSRGRIRHDLSRAAVERDLRGSLQRLGTDYIDLYQIHWPDPATPLDDTMAQLCEMRRKGLIRHIGLSNCSVALVRQAFSRSPIASVQQRYNMLERDAEKELLPFCRRQNIGFVCYSPLAQGILGGTIPSGFSPGRRDVRRLNPLFQDRQKREESIAFAKELEDGAGQALRFLAEQKGVSSILVSMTRREHLLENVRAFEKLSGR